MTVRRTLDNEETHALGHFTSGYCASPPRSATCLMPRKANNGRIAPDTTIVPIATFSEASVGGSTADWRMTSGAVLINHQCERCDETFVSVANVTASLTCCARGAAGNGRSRYLATPRSR